MKKVMMSLVIALALLALFTACTHEIGDDQVYCPACGAVAKLDEKLPSSYNAKGGLYECSNSVCGLEFVVMAEK